MDEAMATWTRCLGPSHVPSTVVFDVMGELSGCSSMGDGDGCSPIV